MKTVLHCVLLLVLCAACTVSARDFNSAATRFVFGVMGDAPYNTDEESQFITLLAEMNHEHLAFAVHLGDFKGATTPCTDELYLQRRDWFDLAHHPFVYVPGDNDWSDCWRPFGAGQDPMERLAKLREVFLSTDYSLGQSKLRVRRQNAGGMAPKAYPEHMRWMYGPVLFVTLNMPGPDNNRTRMPEEAAQRMLAAREWLRTAFARARVQRMPALVVIMHADGWRRTSGLRPAFADLLNDLAAEAASYSGSVLLLHGDTHRYRVDHPLVDPTSRTTLQNVTRVEVFGSPQVEWVRVSVTVDNEKATFAIAPGGKFGATPSNERLKRDL